MAEIVTLPGVFRPELEQETPVDMVLKGARDSNLRDIAYVGRAMDGSLVIGGSHPDADAAIGLLVRGIVDLASCRQVTYREPEDGSPAP